jgi:hypothetical protein
MPNPAWFTPPSAPFHLQPPSSADEIVEDFVYRGDDVEGRITERAAAAWRIRDQVRTQTGTLLRFEGKGN